MGVRGTLLFSLFLLLGGTLEAQHSWFLVKGEDFLAKTNVIFVGHVVERHSYQNERGTIFTRYTFRVTEALKGEPGAEISVTEYGGVVGEVRMTVSHGIAYAPGREYLVFSYRDLLDHNRTLAGPLGQLPVIRDAAGERVVRLYPSHPLKSFLFPKSSTFIKLGEFRKAIERSLESRVQ